MKNLFTYAGLCILAVWMAVSCQTPESEQVPDYFEVLPEELSLSALTTSLSITVRCNLSWNATLEDCPWGTVTVKNVRAGSGGTVIFQTEANLEDEARTGTLVLKAGKSELRKTVTQEGMGTFFSTRDVRLSGKQPFTVTFPNISGWNASVTWGSSWLRISKGTQDGKAAVIIRATEDNQELGDRSGTVTVTVGDASATINVTQGQKDVILIDSETSVGCPFSGQELTFITRYNVDYEVSTNVDWIHHTMPKAPLHEATETFVVDMNPGSDSRSGQILFTSPGHPDATLTVNLTQEGKDPIVQITTPGLYGVNGQDYVLATNGWNQSSLLRKPDGSIRYRLMNAALLQAVTLSGAGAEDRPGETVSLRVNIMEKGSTKFTALFNAVFLHEENGIRWYRAGEDTYFIIL